MIVIDLSKQQALDAMNFLGNLDCNKCAELFFIIEEVKVSILDFSQETEKCSSAVRQEYVDTIRITSSSISSRYKNP